MNDRLLRALEDDRTSVEPSGMSSRRLLRKRPQPEWLTRADQMGFDTDVYYFDRGNDMFEEFEVRPTWAQRGAFGSPDIYMAGRSRVFSQGVGIEVNTDPEAATDLYVLYLERLRDEAVGDELKTGLSGFWKRLGQVLAGTHPDKGPSIGFNPSEKELTNYVRFHGERFPGGFVVPLRARLTKPYTYKDGSFFMGDDDIETHLWDLAVELGADPDDVGAPYAQEVVREHLIGEGYTHIPLGPKRGKEHAFIMLDPAENLRFINAEFRASGKGPLAGAVGGFIVIDQAATTRED